MHLIPDDKLIWKDSCKILPKEMLPFPGLHMIGYAKYSSSVNQLQNHYHNTKEFTIILNGTQDYYVGKEVYTVHGRDVFMTHPHEEHGNNGNPQAICEYVWFQLDMMDDSWADHFLGLPEPFGRHVYQQVANYDLRVCKVDVNEIARLKDAFFCLASGEKNRQLLGYSILLQFIINNLCDNALSVHGGTYSPQIQKAVRYMQEHFRNDIVIEKLAEQAGLSATRFIHNFKEQVGITPHAYVLSLKINEAKLLLRNSEDSITRISHDLNFSSSNHFAAVFKKHTGYTPSQFREMRCSEMKYV